MEEKNFLTGAIARELDFYRIRETIASLTASEEGKALLLQREPSDDEQLVERLKSLGYCVSVDSDNHLPEKMITIWVPKKNPSFLDRVKDWFC